tara:strand:- start:365 stop:550 length:186 start_codon:yes stop_codon:yes gene_type:complete
MKKITKRKSVLLLSTGLFVIAISQLLTHYVEVSDVANGAFFGIGFGLMLTATIFGKFKAVH